MRLRCSRRLDREPRLRPYELRHTSALLAIASGADVEVVQQMLGHASAAMTLDQYGHWI
jgi:integrase